MKILAIILLSTLLSTQAETLHSGTVSYIQDGDTIKVRSDYGGSFTVRLWGIDAPESYFKGQDQGKHAFKAKNYLKQVLPIGTHVDVWAADEMINNNSRVLGRVYLDNSDIAIHLLEMGLVVPYIIYPVADEVTSEYIEASRVAAFKYLGIFDYEEPLEEMPYEFRMRVRKWTSKNYIGDFYTKKYYDPDDYDAVPAWRRIFFESWWDAEDAGYSDR